MRERVRPGAKNERKRKNGMIQSRLVLERGGEISKRDEGK